MLALLSHAKSAIDAAESGGRSVPHSAVELMLTMLQLGQSEEVSKILFFVIRRFVDKFDAVVFSPENEYTQKFCTEVSGGILIPALLFSTLFFTVIKYVVASSTFLVLFFRLTLLTLSPSSSFLPPCRCCGHAIHLFLRCNIME